MSYDTDETRLTQPATIAELVAIYGKAEADIRASFLSIDGALKSLNGTFMLAHFGAPLRGRHDIRVDWSEPEVVIAELRRSIWSCLIDRLQVRKAMSIAAWNALTKEVNEAGPPPAITEENVVGLVTRFRHDVPNMLKAAVDEVFAFLRPPSSRFRTNTELEIGERVVLSRFLSRGFGRSWHVDYYREQHLIALDNVFAILDGKLADDSYKGPLTTAINAIPSGEACHGETPMFEFRGYGNGNLHLRFKRPDLVARLNAIAGGARLKPQTRGAA